MGDVIKINFADAIAQTRDGKRHLLLGNGFSIAFSSKFSYPSLLSSADFTGAEEASEVFKLLGTSDFETVIKALKSMARIAPPYGATSELVNKATRHSEALKDMLVHAIAGHHPDLPSAITPNQVKACRAFLSHFIGEQRSAAPGKIYTLSYDLMLYWVLCNQPTEKDGEKLHINDGFGEGDTPNMDHVVWEALNAKTGSKQRIYYVHGALHLFDDGVELQKKCWGRTGVPLMEQIRDALDESLFPLFVAEGDHESKVSRIRHGSVRTSVQKQAA